MTEIISVEGRELGYNTVVKWGHNFLMLDVVFIPS
jgi:hypothetical protein